MPLQTQSLVMVGLGALGDNPQNNLQPPLVDGIHLRWAFKRELGFPLGGFYLFRRKHPESKPFCLSEAMGNLKVGRQSKEELIKDIRVISNENIILTDIFSPGGLVEFDLDGRQYLRFELPPTRPARWVEMQIGFRNDSTIEAIALLEKIPVAQAVVSGRANDIVTVILEFDAITDIELSPGPAALIDLCLVYFDSDILKNWNLVPNFSYPLCLPVTHPDYPCTLGKNEDLSSARTLARSRIFYGDPDRFTLPPMPTTKLGNITIVNGSPIVIGTGTNWSDELVGAVLQVNGDSTAYSVIQVLGPEKLAISRSYVGASGASKAYAISQDPFGQLHDFLIHLVSGGKAEGSMAYRSLPLRIDNAGTISAKRGSRIINGVGTNWISDMAGLTLQVIGPNIGVVSLFNGSLMIFAYGATWDQRLVGMALNVEGEQITYTILNGFTHPLLPMTAHITLDRAYSGTTGTKSYKIFEKVIYRISHIDSPTQLTLDRGYLSEDGTGKNYVIISALQSPKTGENRDPPRMQKQHPLDIVLMGALNPAVAQMLGLYWVDQTAEPFVAYDYLILGDYENEFGGDSQKALDSIREGKVEGYIVFNKKKEPAPHLAPPSDIRVYALPGSFRPEAERQNNAGIRWDLGRKDNELPPGKPVMYHIWRAYLNDGETPTSLPNQYELITYDVEAKQERPMLITKPPQFPPGKAPQRSGDWPPFPMYAIDNSLKDGWYSFKVSGIDIFGRHSSNSDPAKWYQWMPIPDPRPWYYQEPQGERAIHPFAIRLLDKIPPPSPTAIEAYPLDPADPLVVKDDAYNEWRKTHENLVGLRVRWQWTEAHMKQAPDTEEFRIYYQPGHMNALVGRTRNVLIGNKETDVETDISNALSTDAFKGASLQIGSTLFEILASESTNPLRLRVRSGSLINAGVANVEDNKSIVYGVGTDWDTDLDLIGLKFKVAGEKDEYTILNVFPVIDVSDPHHPTSVPCLKLDRNYHGSSGTKAYTIEGKKPRANAPCTIIIPSIYNAGTVSVANGSNIVKGTGTGWKENLSGRLFKVAGESTEYTIERVDSETRLTLRTNYAGIDDLGKAYSIRHPLFIDYSKNTNWEKRIYIVDYNDNDHFIIGPGNTRKFEVFLALPDTGKDEPFAPTLAKPIVYANIGVSAADYRKHTADAPKWSAGGWGGRYGNEGPVGPSAKIFRVMREEPKKPDPPPESEKVFATKANYQGQSFYTYRWQPAYAPDPKDQQKKIVLPLRCHIFRALDDSLFKVDWSQPARNLLDPAKDRDLFPPDWEGDKCSFAANRLNELLSKLKELKKPGSGVDERTAINEYHKFFGDPKKLYLNDALRVLAGLSGNERAFSQLTIQPLDPNDLEYANKRGPDDPDDFKLDDPDHPLWSKDLRIYIDALDGRSSNRYFYRSAYVDGAGNCSVLSLSSPPVWLPKTVPPRAPVITKILGGDKEIILTWASNREPDLKEYQVYRAESEEEARDLRLMKIVHTKQVLEMPDQRSAGVEWTDNVPGLVTFFYRVVAVDSAGNVSTPSQIMTSRGYDLEPPEPPTWVRAEWVLVDAGGNEHPWGTAPPTGQKYEPVVALEWNSKKPYVSWTVQRRLQDSTLWRTISPRLDVYQVAGKFPDKSASPTEAYAYRIRGEDIAAKVNIVYIEKLLPKANII